jgi:hypothetical protein
MRSAVLALASIGWALLAVGLLDALLSVARGVA